MAVALVAGVVIEMAAEMAVAVAAAEGVGQHVAVGMDMKVQAAVASRAVER